MKAILQRFKPIAIALAVVFLLVGCSYAPPLEGNPWQVRSLPTDSTFSDLAFTDDLSRGWLVGSNATLFETDDTGKTWKARPLDFEGEKVRLNSVSFSGDEGWIVGEPAVLLHTLDGGDTWYRVPLSEKLPGSPSTITALGPHSAEMTTNVGAIYRTENDGQNWTGLVQEALGVFRNISRAEDGKYVAVSSRGNFFSIWNPEGDTWQPFNRQSSRRLQNMGFGPDGSLWVLARGGQLQFSEPNDPESWLEPLYPEFSTSWGLLDLAYRTPEEMWVVGGGGNLMVSFDGGQTWLKDREIQDVPSNLNRVKFINPELGFILGQRGTLLRYEGPSEAA
ncbi:photosystem II assembly protein [Leptolyngbya valderiana BDU 20041]|uniref:photosynthesis system II assembly factor Ycf48 n=1 Tax=Baaleninema simplex TaxID=2862350 RepID=UPI000348DD7B|nr:photosynthesis system II assembly factor Ycf48 [Baaleninema simplex]OAB58996.1 photosystem II assembly protein [Leptolyngbya valderiana BDU 20041]PPT07735.1 Photosystem II stability/assembly factor [Geitlerinema sp. FC II]